MSNATGDVQALKSHDSGMLMTLVRASADLLDESMGAALGAGKTARSELVRFTMDTIEWVEAAQQSSFKLLRDAVQRADALSVEVFDAVESIATAASRAVRNSGLAAGEMVSRAADSLVASKESSAKAA